MNAAPVVRLGDTRVLVMRERGQWFAIVGVPLLAEPGSTLSVEVDGRSDAARIRVGTKSYPEQHLTIPPERDDLSTAELEQFEREREHLSQLLRTFSDTAPATLHLVAPAKGRRTGSFGIAALHQWLAARAAFGPRHRSASGHPRRGCGCGPRDRHRQLLLPRRERSCSTMARGSISLYAHLRRRYLGAGDAVAAGSLIGEVGATGRATGPHLHFAVYLNGAAVDPRLLLRK